MAIAKKGHRKIKVDGNQFLWRVRKKISWNEIHNSPLGIPIQHIDGGRVMIVYLGFSRSYFERNNEFPITPSLIEKCIRKGIASGWTYMEQGNQIELDCRDICTEVLSENSSSALGSD